MTYTLDVVAESGVAFRLKLTVDEIPKRTKVTFFHQKGGYPPVTGPDGEVLGVYYADTLMQSNGVHLTNSDDDIDNVTYRHICDWLSLLVDREVFKV